MMADTLMLFNGKGHPIHRAFGESIDARFYEIEHRIEKGQFPLVSAFNLFSNSLSIPGNFQKILCESCYYYPAFKRRIGLLGKAKIINLNGGPLYYHLLSGRLAGTSKNLLLDLLKEVDGHLVFGEYGLNLAKKLNVTKPVKKVYPFIRPAVHKKLESVNPDLETHNMAIVATSDPYCKALDVLFKSFNEVAGQYKDAHLTVITYMDANEIRAIPGFNAEKTTIMVNAPDISIPLAKSSLYLQPSRGDMFPVSCLEAMAAGVPSVVSDENGVCEVVEKIAWDMVIPVDHKRLTNSILSYFEKTSSERKELSKKSRAAVAQFNQKNMLDRFKKEFTILKLSIPCI